MLDILLDYILIYLVCFMCLVFYMYFCDDDDSSEDCSHCSYYVEVEGQKECTYSQNREIDNAGFYIDELPCERRTKNE